MTPDKLEAGLLALERLRGEIDDAVLDLAQSALRDRQDALRRGSTPEQRLRQATVLFVDVVGSTALGGKLEPEEIHLVMDTALARFTDIVDRFNGRVLQYAGDSLLAAFGTQEVREDDAENAVLAGLGIVAEARLQADRVRREHGHPGFNVRVGLHTGPVLLGGGVDAANTIRGATVNMAARMEQAAPPGTLRISAATQRLVAGQFELLEQPPLQVKGHAEPLRTWLVERRLHGAATAQRGVAGLQTPLIGRQDAVLALQQAWQRLHVGSNGSPDAVRVATQVLVGEAGLGKSRVLGHWQAWARAQPQRALWLQAQGRPQQERVPYAMLRNLLSDALTLPDSDTPALARERFTASVAPWLQPDFGADAAVAEAQVLGHLLGLNFSASPHLRGILQQGAQIRQRGLHSAAVLLAQLASSRSLPLLLCLDDMHWADDASLDFVRSLPLRGLTVPVLVLLATRPTLDERRPDGLDPLHSRTLLSPLSPADSTSLAQALLLPLQPPAPVLQDLLVQRAGGNPFFMEELLQMLFDQGVLQAGGGEGARWVMKEGVLDLQAVPATLSGVLQARLGALPAGERLALQQASVLGPVFLQPTLGAIDASAPPHLPALCRRALLQGRAAMSADSAAEFAFAHVILQQVAYARLLRREKQPLHGAAARWYAALDTARAADYLGVAADHYEQAGEPLLAVRYRLLAAEDLAQRFAHAAVVEQASRGLALLNADEGDQGDEGDSRDTRWRLLLLRQRGLRLGGQPQAQAQDLQALAALAVRSQNPQHLAIVALRQAVAADETGHPQEAAALAPPALAAARAAADTALELASYAVWAGALRASGEHAQARTVAAEGLARARECKDGFAESELLVAGAAIATEQGDGTASATLLRQALLIQQERGDRAGECVSRVNLGAAALQLGDFAGAEADLKEAQRLSRLIGNRTVELTTVINLATTRLPLLRLAEAQADAQAAVALAQAIRNPEYEAFAHITLGSVLLAQGDSAGACAAFTGAEDLLHGLGLQHLGIEAVAWRARARLQAGDAQAAAQDVDAVLAHQARHGHFNGTEKPHLIRLVCCQVLQARQDLRAAAVLSDSWQALQRDAQAIAETSARSRYLEAHAHHRELRRLAQAAGLSV